MVWEYHQLLEDLDEVGNQLFFPSRVRYGGPFFVIKNQFLIKLRDGKKILFLELNQQDKFIGNYFGALKQFVDTANSGEYLTHVFWPRYHALTSVNDKEKLQNFRLIYFLILIGLDPKRFYIVNQSFARTRRVVLDV